MSCKDCKGTGVYQPLFGPTEDCRSCTTHDSDIQVGDTLYVFDTSWYKTVVDTKYKSYASRDKVVHFVKSLYSCGSFSIPQDEICWNLTDRRWEYIRAGTPLYH